MPEFDEDQQADALSDDAENIAQFLNNLPAPNTELDRPTLPYLDLNLSGADITPLIDLRREHQTKQAESGTRTSNKTPNKSTPSSEKQAILRGFNEAIKQREEIGVGTGVGRMARWRNPAPGGRDGKVDGEVSSPAMAGNSANAAAAATSAAKKVSILDPVAWPLDSQTEQLLARRKAVIKKFKLPTDLETARISQLSPLQIADSKKLVKQAYGFAIVGDKVVVAKGT